MPERAARLCIAHQPAADRDWPGLGGQQQSVFFARLRHWHQAKGVAIGHQLLEYNPCHRHVARRTAPAEEGSNAHSKIARAQVPWAEIDWKEAQQQFRSTWYGQQKLSLTEAALAFNSWLGTRGVAEALLEKAPSAIRAGCLPYERPFCPVRDERQRLDRLYVRMARFFRRGVREDFSHHSRVAEYFVGNDVAPHSETVSGFHGEHVVPCAVLRDIAFACFAERWSVSDVAALMKRLLVVAYIPQEAKQLLDSGRHNLRDRMPDTAWRPLEGCIYARFHAKGIDVPFVADYPCTCGPKTGTGTSGGN